MDLSLARPIFIGIKMDGQMRRRIETLSGPDRKYVSSEDSTFLRICRQGENLYVGKVVHERLSTDRVDDVRRNVVSILQRLCPEMRLPDNMDIVPCEEPSQEPGS